LAVGVVALFRMLLPWGTAVFYLLAFIGGVFRSELHGGVGGKEVAMVARHFCQCLCECDVVPPLLHCRPTR